MRESEVYSEIHIYPGLAEYLVLPGKVQSWYAHEKH